MTIQEAFSTLSTLLSRPKLKAKEKKRKNAFVITISILEMGIAISFTIRQNSSPKHKPNLNNFWEIYFFYSQQKQAISLQFSTEIKFKSICIEFFKLWGKKIEFLLHLNKQDNWKIQSQSPHHLLRSFTVDGREISSINSFKWSDSSLPQDYFWNVIFEIFPSVLIWNPFNSFKRFLKKWQDDSKTAQLLRSCFIWKPG